MSTTLAQIILLGITALAFGVWLWGMRFRRKSRRMARKDRKVVKAIFPGLDFSSGDWQHGQTEVDGTVTDLVKRAADRLVQNGVHSQMPVKVTTKSSQLLCYESMPGTTGSVRRFQRGLMRFTDAGNGRTRIDYALDLSPLRRLLTIAEVLQYVGLFAIIICYGVIDAFVANSGNTEVRAQTFQMFQVGHILWPPLLLIGQFRCARRSALGAVDGFVCNLPYGEQAATK